MDIKQKTLEKLLEILVSRDSFYVPGAKSQKVELQRKDKLYDGLRNKLELEEEMHVLESTGYVDVIWSNGIFISVILRKDEPTLARLFRYLGQEDPRIAASRQIELLRRWTTNPHPVVRSFAIAMTEKLTDRRPATKNYYSDEEQLQKYLVAMDAIAGLEQETFYRNLSMKLFGNSKELEGMASKLNSLFREFDERSYDEEEEPLAIYGLIKNPIQVRLKGPIAIKVGEQEIDLSSWPNFFALNDEAIARCSVTSGNPKRVITIENLTSFSAFNDPEAITIYLAGFHDKVKQSLLLKIFEAFPDIPYLHFGDMDSGGFYIFHHLKVDTRIPFSPFKMDVESFLSVERFALPLSPNDRKRLTAQLDDPSFQEFHELIALMLEKNEKVEQEAFIALEK